MNTYTCLDPFRKGEGEWVEVDNLAERGEGKKEEDT